MKLFNQGFVFLIYTGPSTGSESEEHVNVIMR